MPAAWRKCVACSVAMQTKKNRRMKKLYTFISVALLGMAPLFGQTAKDCFKAMPDSLTPLLTEVNKADCIDFLESKMKAEVTNRLSFRCLYWKTFFLSPTL